jgi:preprotein translocase SecE subunit
MSITSYFKETTQELKQVKWPKRTQVILVTIAVVVITGAIGYFLGFFDFLFSTGLSKLIG